MCYKLIVMDLFIFTNNHSEQQAAGQDNEDRWKHAFFWMLGEIVSWKSYDITVLETTHFWT